MGREPAASVREPGSAWRRVIRILVLFGAGVFVHIQTFGRPLQPQLLSLDMKIPQEELVKPQSPIKKSPVDLRGGGRSG